MGGNFFRLRNLLMPSSVRYNHPSRIHRLGRVCLRHLGEREIETARLEHTRNQPARLNKNLGSFATIPNTTDILARMEPLSVAMERIAYYNPANRYAFLRLPGQRDKRHPKYGPQFKAEVCEPTLPAAALKWRLGNS